MRIFLILLATFFLTSCAIKNQYAEISYTAKKVPALSDLVTARPFSIGFQDTRENKEVIGHIENMLGMKTAKIFSSPPIAEVFEAALEKELLQRGFASGKNGCLILINLQKCYVDYEAGILFTKAVARIQMEMHVFDEEKKLLFSKEIKELGKQSPIFVYSGKNAGKAIEKALHEALATFFADSQLFSCLKKA